ncbi:Glutathione-regulated potassium-efflux system protein KefB [uncultured archaeon]|nr:Glutathione-regulated potassium-efflux system protein KefB [uncultured archaeon]
MIEVSFLLFIVACILGFAFSALFKKLGFTPLIGFVIAGLILGPIGFHVFDNNEFSTFLELLGLAGILFFLGLEFDVNSFKECGFFAITFALVDLGISLNLGMLAILLFKLNITEGILAGLILFSSSTLFALKLFKDEIFDSKLEKVVKTILSIQDVIAIMFLLFIKEVTANGITSQTGLSIAIILFFFTMQLILNLLISKKNFNELAAVMYSGFFAIVFGILTYIFDWPGYLTGFAAGIALNPFKIGKRIRSGVWFFKELFILMFIIGITAQINSLKTPFGLSPIAFAIGTLLLIIVFCLVRLYAMYFFSKLSGFESLKGIKTGSVLLGIGEFGFILALLVPAYKEELFLLTLIIVIASEILSKIALSNSAFLENFFDRITPKTLKIFFARIELTRTNSFDYVHPNEEIKLENVWLKILRNFTGLLIIAMALFVLNSVISTENNLVKILTLIVGILIIIITAKKILKSWKELYEINLKGLENKPVPHSMIVLETIGGFSMLLYFIFLGGFFSYYNYTSLNFVFISIILLNLLYVFRIFYKIRKHYTTKLL